MNRKVLMTLHPLLAIAAFRGDAGGVGRAGLPLVRNGALIPEGKKVQTTSWGTIALTCSAATGACKEANAETIENPVGGATRSAKP